MYHSDEVIRLLEEQVSNRNNRNLLSGCAGCMKPCAPVKAGISRRTLFSTGAAAIGAGAASSRAAFGADPDRQQPILQKLKVQPVLQYQIYQRKQATSWRSWGGLLNEQLVREEEARRAVERREAA